MKSPFDFAQDSNIILLNNKDNAQKPKPRFNLLNGDDLGFKSKAPHFLINDILESDAHGLIIGKSQSFKSFFVLKLAHSICTGKDFLGHKVFNTGKVLYISGEGQGALSRRIKALQIKDGDFNNNLLCITDIGNINDKDTMEVLKEQINEIKPALVIFDTFASLVNDVDENSSSQVSKVLKLIKETCRNGYTSSIIVHHHGKDDSRGARGASSFGSDSDFVFELKRDSDLENMTSTVKCEKMKDGELFKPFSFIARVVELGLPRQDGKETTSLVIEDTDYKPVSNNKAKSLNDRQQDVLSQLHKAIESHGISPTNEIKELFKDSPHLTPTKVVHKDKWRELAYMVIDADSTNSKKTAFNRCIDSLKSSGYVGFLDSFYWITK